MDNDNLLGNIYISNRAIATIAYQSVVESYGVVGLAPKNFAKSITEVLVKDPTRGVDVHFDGKAVHIDLFVIIEYGTRIKTVATTLAETVKYKLETLIGIPVAEVNVHVRGLRISNID